MLIEKLAIRAILYGNNSLSISKSAVHDSQPLPKKGQVVCHAKQWPTPPSSIRICKISVHLVFHKIWKPSSQSQNPFSENMISLQCVAMAHTTNWWLAAQIPWPLCWVGVGNFPFWVVWPLFWDLALFCASSWLVAVYPHLLAITGCCRLPQGLPTAQLLCSLHLTCTGGYVLLFVAFLEPWFPC